MKNITNAAIYVRCSTSHQNTTMQENDLKEYCKRRGWAVHDIYADRGISGATEERPELKRLMKDAKKKKFDVVVVWRFDRFGRSTSHLVSALTEFQNLGIDFVSFNESIDTSTPVGKVLFTVISAMAEFERSIIRERVQAGVDRARVNGVQLGRPRAGFDYKRAIELRKNGWSYKRIGRELGVSAATVWRVTKDAV